MSGYNQYKYRIRQMIASLYPEGERTEIARKCADELRINLSTVYRTMQLRKGTTTPNGAERRGRTEVVKWFAAHFGCEVSDLMNEVGKVNS